MEGFQIRGWDLILPGSCWLYEPQPLNQQSASVVGVSTPCEAVPTRGVTVFVPGVLDLYIYGRIFDPGKGPYPPRVALALRTQDST